MFFFFCWLNSRRIHVSKKDEVNYELLKEKIRQVLEKNGTILDHDLYDGDATTLEKIQVHKKIVSVVIPGNRLTL